HFQHPTDQIMLGAVGVKMRSTAELCANVKEYGAIGDGRSHPLSERYGSVAEAKADYPHATSLEDEIDWAAIQAAIAATVAAGGPGAVCVPAGQYLITKTLSLTTSHPLHLFGVGAA